MSLISEIRRLAGERGEQDLRPFVPRNVSGEESALIWSDQLNQGGDGGAPGAAEGSDVAVEIAAAQPTAKSVVDHGMVRFVPPTAYVVDL